MVEQVSVIQTSPDSASQSQPDISADVALQETSVLSVEGLKKSYRKRAVVDGVSLEIRQREIVGLLGPNGAGKTTVFYMIVGLERSDRGKISLDSKEISGFPMYIRARHGPATLYEFYLLVMHQRLQLYILTAVK